MIDSDQLNLDAPTPGQSLTTEPGGRPWENPPQFTDTVEVLDFYAGELLQPEQAAKLMEVLETGFSVPDIIDAITLGGVMQGKHTLDTGVLVAPHLNDIIVALADKMDVKYNDGRESGNSFSDELMMSSVKRSENESEEALEKVEQEQIQSFMESTKGGLMSKPIESAVEETEE
tara:strand:- start:768 stop:1289 length:522 start_codon:yes stop_codon:yes gene_type:complete